jgi:hypothetical protein
MLEAMVRIASARPATPRSMKKYSLDRFPKLMNLENLLWG